MKVRQRKRLADKSADQLTMVDDTGLRQFVGYHIKRAYNVLHGDLKRILEPMGLRISTYSSLVLITENPGIRQSELASTLDIERPNMVVILDDLERRGWITRKQVQSDRRAYALFATLRGKRICQRAVALDKAHEAKLMNNISEKQVAELIRALNKMERGLPE